MCYTVRKKICSPLFWYKAIIVWFSHFIMTVVQNVATLSEKRRPGTGSSPKTAGSQSVKIHPSMECGNRIASSIEHVAN